MRHCLVLATVLLIFTSVLPTACARQPLPAAPGAQGMGLTEFVDSLRKAGATVEVIGDSRRPEPTFSVTGKDITINTEHAEVFEFSNEATAETEANFVSPDGWKVTRRLADNRTTILDFNWIAPPHWYKSGRIILIYAGENQSIMSLLESLLGKQFAGR